MLGVHVESEANKGPLARQLGHSEVFFKARHNVCLLGCLWAQHLWLNWVGVDMDVQDVSQI